MNNVIDTGGQFIGCDSACEDQRPVYGEHRVLFDFTSTVSQTGIITVNEDSPIMLVAYVLPDDAELVVEGVSVGSRSVPQGGGCCSPCGPSLESSGIPDIRFRWPMTLGGNTWKLSATNRRLVINLPGTYILVLADDQYIGSVYVEALSIGHIKTILPAQYLAGI